MEELAQGRMFLGQDFLHDAVVAGERELSGQQLKHHDSDGKNVGTAVEGLVFQALGRHVLDGADHMPGAGEMPVGFFLPGDAEVEQLQRCRPVAR